MQKSAPSVTVKRERVMVELRGDGRTKDAEFGHLVKLQMTEGDIISDVDIMFTPFCTRN